MSISDKNMPHLGKKIERLRILRGFNLKEMADRLGMSERNYRRVEEEAADHKMSLLESIAKEFEISVVDLLSFDERVFFHNCEQAHAFGHNNTYHGSSLKERELYEARITQYEAEIGFLRKQLEALAPVKS